MEKIKGEEEMVLRYTCEVQVLLKSQAIFGGALERVLGISHQKAFRAGGMCPSARTE